MALPISSLSISCNFIAEFVRDGLNAAANNIRVVIGPPSEAVKTKSDHVVNLFFYRFEPSGFQSAVTPGQPWLIRLDCLVTAFCLKESQISPGENELRLLGEVMRIFHQTPVLATLDVNGEDTRLQVVFQPLSSEQLNQVWSTQPDTSYRSSVAYEMALVPVVPSVRDGGQPLVGSTGSEVRARMDTRHAPYSGDFVVPPVTAETVNIEVEGWAPLICFVIDGQYHKSLALNVGSAVLANFKPRAWVAGDPGATVTLRWSVWDTNLGWRNEGQVKNVNPISLGIDPDSGPPSLPPRVTLPFDDHPGQAVLYAERRFTRESNGAQMTVRSNPLLVTLY